MEHIGAMTQKRINSFNVTDTMPPELRACVHEYGYAIVHVFLQHGIRKPSVIHQIVRECWEGARQPSQKRPDMGTLDWLLVQREANISAAELIRALRYNDLLVVPRTPTRQMLTASMAEVSGFNERITKTEKHRRRLAAALIAAAEHLVKPEEIGKFVKSAA